MWRITEGQTQRKLRNTGSGEPQFKQQTLPYSPYDPGLSYSYAKWSNNKSHNIGLLRVLNKLMCIKPVKPVEQFSTDVNPYYLLHAIFQDSFRNVNQVIILSQGLMMFIILNSKYHTCAYKQEPHICQASPFSQDAGKSRGK